MAVDGKNASFVFAGTTYSSSDCLQSTSLNAAVAEVTYFCSGVEKVVAGTKTITFAASLALSATDTTKVSALDEGSTGSFEYHPAGDSTSYVENTSTRALVTSNVQTAAPNSVVLMDITMRLDDITRATAA
jgi:hypothetical protein